MGDVILRKVLCSDFTDDPVALVGIIGCSYCIKNVQERCPICHSVICQNCIQHPLHQMECSSFIHELCLSEHVLLALRVLLSFELNLHKNRNPFLPIQTREKHVWNCNGLFSNDVHAFESLVDHWDKISSDISLYHSITQRLSIRISPSQLMESVFKIQCNSMAIKGMKETMNQQMSVIQEETLGLALYLNAALLNHSCSPNCITLFNGTQLIIKSKPGKKDKDEPTISYGPLASRMSLKERREILMENWHFYCRCDACLYEELESTQKCDYKCMDCDGLFAKTVQQCPKCQLVIDWKAVAQKEKEAHYLLSSFNRIDLEKSLKLMIQIYAPFHLNIAQAHDALAHYYAQNEQWKLSSNHCEKSLTIIRSTHGAESIEVFHESVKLCHILMQQPSKKTREVVKSTLALAFKLFPPGPHEFYQDVQELKQMYQLLKL